MEANRATSGNVFMGVRIAVTVDVRQVGFQTGWVTPKWFLACCLLVVTAAGCLVSEQIGEPVGHGSSRMASDDVVIHFDTQFNRIVVFGRSAAIAVIALWIVSTWGAKPGSILVGVALLVTAGWLVAKDYPSMTGYRLEVAPEGLTLKVPPDLDTLIRWESVEGLELEGFGYGRIAGNIQFDGVRMVRQTALELPDWRTMKLTLAGGQSHLIQLDELSIEHRQIFARALIKRAGLVED